ncbi:MAG: HDIG domain-containing protein [Candidatus Sericytochromatia bacterium]|nr:HDIG domain-containing protein [Candidatus Sericytochromatia bacterium]
MPDTPHDHEVQVSRPFRLFGGTVGFSTFVALAVWGLMLSGVPSWWPVIVGGSSPPWVAAALLLAVLGTGAGFVHVLNTQESELQRTHARHGLLGTLTLGLFGLVAILTHLGAPALVTPLPAAAIMVSLFLNQRVAMTAVLAWGLLLQLLPSQGPDVLVLGGLGSWAALQALRRVRERWDVGRAGFRVAAVMAGTTLAVMLLRGRGWDEAGLSALHAALSGPMAVVLGVGLLPYLEKLSGIVTPFTLLELANPAQPLLRTLLLKAPGTYHHSILVGNLGEAAAEAVGADPLLVRVGAYYHDVGKTKRPYFFIENQQGMPNQHDQISPRLSALVITAHVREGIELAREHRLPEQVAAFIPTHHGCSLVSYFYHQAREAEGGEEVLEEHFRYPGPRPTTKETAIVMLADGVEATCRTLTRPSPEQIEATIRRIVQKRVDEGELSEAPLTLAEIEVIIGVFNRILQGLYHQRIEYPDQLLEREERARREDRRRLGGSPRA